MAKRKTKAESREAVLAAIKKKFGNEVVKASDFEEPHYDVFPTGCLSIDIELGVGGFPRGRIIELWGPESSGKSCLTLHTIAQAQKKGTLCAFVDAEHALDLYFAEGIGVDLDALDYLRPNTGEEALEVVEALTETGEYGLIVIDSVAALVPSAELEGEMGSSHVGLQARLMNQALRKLTGIISKTGTTVIFLNQVRQKVGVMFGSPDTTPGGNGLKFYASQRLEIRRIGSIKVGDEVIGNRTKLKVVKNKLAGTAYRHCEFDIYSNNEYGCGICSYSDVFENAVKLNLIDKSGAWYSYEGEQIGQGKNNAVAFLKENPEIVKSLSRAIVEQRPLKPHVRDAMLARLDGNHDEEDS